MKDVFAWNSHVSRAVRSVAFGEPMATEGSTRKIFANGKFKY
jgi:hypothetical protein